MTAAVVAGLLAGYGIAIPVGAVGAYLVAVTARAGWRTGAGAALGVATADWVYALVAVAGGSALVPVLAPVMPPCGGPPPSCSRCSRYGPAGRRSPRTVRADWPPATTGWPSSARAYLAFLGITILNPMTVIYFAALVLATALRPRDPHRPHRLRPRRRARLGQLAAPPRPGRHAPRPHPDERPGRLGTALASSTLIVVLAVRLVGGG
ncbi:LysE family transporter [Streptomyces tanashiensis]